MPTLRMAAMLAFAAGTAFAIVGGAAPAPSHDMPAVQRADQTLRALFAGSNTEAPAPQLPFSPGRGDRLAPALVQAAGRTFTLEKRVGPNTSMLIQVRPVDVALW